VDYRATLTADRRRIALFNEECLKRGLIKAVNKIYVSAVHTDADVDETLGIFDAALAAVAARTR
jgi:glutamate-1-semialdehyde aminotransferase